jgi:hypothetical protein
MSEYEYDVFISYSSADQEWVQSELLPRLTQAGLTAITERGFEIGAAKLSNRERAVESSRHTLIVLTPAWLESEWASFEALLVQTDDPVGRQRRMIPLLLCPCEPPRHIAMLERIDLTDPSERDAAVVRLLGALSRKARVFLCYKRTADPDQGLARYLHDLLSAHGHDVFVDTFLRTGGAWLEEIDRQIKASDFLVVLLSQESADSEMVQAEVRRAYEYRRLQEHPQTLPIRMAYEGLLPYSIDAFLDPVQYVVWQTSADNERVGYDILAAIQGRLPEQAPIQIPSVGETSAISEDGRPVHEDGDLHPPLPEFDPRFLELDAPGGTVKLRSEFYVERDADGQLKREILRSGTMTTIRAARQTGKSSLLVRGAYHARQNGAQVVNIDLQRVDRDRLASPVSFLRYLAECIVRKLRLDLDEVARLWRDSLGPQDNLTYLMEDYVLPESEASVVLTMDEVDRLLTTSFHSDFFALLRSWYNSAAYDELWERLNIVMVISTEPFLLIQDLNQSPFNVGLRLHLRDFDEAQMRDLIRRHGTSLGHDDFRQFVELLSGHPYLTRKALYTLVNSGSTWEDLYRVAPTDQGPFSDHLRHYYWVLRQEPDLRQALKQVIRQGSCADDMALFRLLGAGLVKESGEAYSCRCDLYRMYFQGKL